MTELIAAAVVTVLASARLTRLIAFDVFPPSAWLRAKWDALTEDTSWNPLLRCHYCLTPWTTLAVAGAGWASDLHPAWWAFNGWLALSYASAIIVARDGDDD